MKAPAILFSLILSAVFLMLLFFGGSDTLTARWGRAAWNLGHIPCFAIWTYLFLVAGPRAAGRSFGRQAVEVLGLAFLTGTAIELLQAAIGRSGRVTDLMLDMVGTLIVLSFFAPARKSAPRPLLRSLQGLTVLFLLLALVPLVRAVIDGVLSRRQFPLLSTFETPLEADRWRGDAEFRRDGSTAAEGDWSLRVRLSTEQYSGATLRFFPRDWRGYRFLHISVRNSTALPLPIRCRIHDEPHYARGGALDDRYTTSFTLEPGWNEISIPLAEVEQAPRERPMSMDGIQGVMIYSVALAEPVVINLDDLRLVADIAAGGIP
jgi:hypothetical protein